MRPHEQQILQYVVENGPCSCKGIAEALGMDRQIVYRFLYKANCNVSMGGRLMNKGWIDNIKPIPSVLDDSYSAAISAPGQYVATQAGRDELAKLTG